MKTVGIRELKDHLSEYLRRVRGGESVLVTDRGEVVCGVLTADTRRRRYVASPTACLHSPGGDSLLSARRPTAIGTKCCHARVEAAEAPLNFSKKNADPGETLR